MKQVQNVAFLANLEVYLDPLAYDKNWPNQKKIELLENLFTSYKNSVY